MDEATPRTFTFGELLDGAFTLYRRNFVAFFGAALIPQIPIVVFWLAAPLWIGAEEGMTIASFLLTPYNLFAYFLVLGALTLASAEAYAGRAPRIEDVLRGGLRRWFPLAIAALCAGVMIMVGFLFFIVPGFILLAMFFAFAPATMLEGRGPVDALGRSRALSRGGRLRILAVLGVAWIITMLPAMALLGIGGIGALAVGVGTGGVGAEAVLSTWFMALTNAVGPIVNALIWPFAIGVSVLLYFDRRARTEAPDLEVAVDQLQPEG